MFSTNRFIKVLLPIFVPAFYCIQHLFYKLGNHYENLQSKYAQPIDKWPKPWVDLNVPWEELEGLPYDVSFFEEQEQPIAQLGKLLFFDPRLSGSNQISCSSCHDPQLGWSDGRDVALGNDHLQGHRNSISILNVKHRRQLFWDGRVKALEDQALSPILAHHEMAGDTTQLIAKLKRIKGYTPHFELAFGAKKWGINEILEALAAFQKTIKGRQSRFDLFVAGDYTKLSDQEIKGLHLFRTKGRCMNCHYGPYFTDHKFHNIGLTYYKRDYQDLGRFHITQNPEDVGRFQTPMLRDVMNSGPWMHNGLFDDMKGIISLYNSGMQMINPSKEEKLADPLFPITDPLLKPLQLDIDEIDAIAAFMESITATSYKMERPKLPN